MIFFLSLYWICYNNTSILCFVFLARGMWNLSSLTRDRTCTPCFGSQTLNRWTAREVPRTSVFKLCQAIWSAARNENPGLAGCYSPFLRKVSDQGSRCQPCLSHACQVETLDSHPTLTKPGKNLGSPSYLWPVSETGLAVFNNVQWAWWCHQGSSLFPVSISFFFFLSCGACGVLDLGSLTKD